MPQNTEVDAGNIDGFVGPASLRKEIASRFETCVTYFKDWNEVAKEDYEFALGKQWTDADRQTLADESRPCLTFNRIWALINMISGYQRENSARIKVNPEGGEDKIFSEVMDKAIVFIDKMSNLNYTMGQQFDEGCYVGKSFLEAYRTYDKDPIRGELHFEMRSPYEIMTDPEFRGYDLNDGCGYLFKIKKYTKFKLVELFPEKERLIKGLVEDIDDATKNFDVTMVSGDGDDMGNRPNSTTVLSQGSDVEAEPLIDDDKKYTLKEYWRFKRVQRYFVIEKESGEPRKFKTRKEAEDFAAAQGMLADGTTAKVIDRKVKEMWVASQVGGILLDDKESPMAKDYDGYPFFRFLAEWTPNAENELYRVQGMTRRLKDPQREKNKAKSQALHILNTQANSGWIADDDALSPSDFDKLEQFGSKPGLVIKKKRNAELREILPKTQNQGFIIREQQADEEFKQISNINPDLMGLQDSNSTSGKAMQIRIKQGMLSLSRLFSNYRYTKQLIGNFILSMIPSMFDAQRLAKVLGQKFMEANQLTEGTLAAYLIMVRDDKYDVMVAEADTQATLRYETLQGLIEVAKAGAPIPPTLFVEYMDLPNSEEVKKEISAYQQQVMAAQANKGQGTPAR